MKNTASLLAGLCLGLGATCAANANPALPMDIAGFLVPIPDAAPAGGEVAGPQLAELLPFLYDTRAPALRPVPPTAQHAR